MPTLAFDYVPLWAAICAAGLEFTAWLIRRRASRTPAKPVRGALARVERGQDGVVVVLPPQPGVRLRALLWTLLPTLMTAYVCLIIDGSAEAWALFVGTTFVMAGMAAWAARPVFPFYYHIDARGTLRIARGWRSWPGPAAPLSPPKTRSVLSLGRDKGGPWYLHHNGEEEHEVWGRLSNEDAEVLRSLGVPNDRTSPSPLPRWTMSSWLSVLAGFTILAGFLHPVFSLLASVRDPEPLRLRGDLRTDHPDLGRWHLVPQRCLSGRERGFEGVLLQFPNDSAVRELRVDMEHADDVTLELRFFDPDKAPLRIAQRECERVESTVNASVLILNARDLDLLEGTLRIDCARYGMHGEVSYRGCLP